jgi:trimeric autotransporter adhesin
MNSFKKIALVLAAALTGSVFAVPSAHAAPMSVALTVNGSAPSTAGTAITTAVELPVPADNSVDAIDALKFVVTVDTGTAVTVSATNASIILATATAAAPVTASSGSASSTIATGTGTTATFFVFTKTTAVGTVSITNQGETKVYYVQGQVGKINNISVAGLDVGASGTQVTLTVAATDVFGNKVSGKSITAVVANGTLDTTTATTGVGLTDFGTRDFKVTLPTTGSAAVIFSVTTASDLATAVTGFNTVTSSVAKNIAVRDLAAELAAAQAALATEKAARDADKAAAASAAATAKAASDAAAVTAAADLVKANAEIATLKANAVIAKAAADKALADAAAAHAAELAKVKADNDTALKSVKDAFNALAKKWNAKNPKAKVALVK